jgi:tRNA A37 methylthiotransferase MiaB
MKFTHKLAKKIFHLIMIQPSHYDDDGYIIQWVRSSIPANTLATLYGLAQDCAKRHILGEDVQINLRAYDETNTRIKIKHLVRLIRKSGGHGLVALVGVQANQFPRAMDMARQFRAENIQVCLGGFHVSGCIAMLPKILPDLQEAMDRGISLFAGELEDRLELLLQDAFRKELKPLYNYLLDLPGLDGVPGPYLPPSLLKRTAGTRTSFDAGRGCPFQCSFCTIINVQGRKSRYRTPDDVERIVRVNMAQGVTKFFITDDNFARNKNWEVLFDRLIQLREVEGLEMTFTIQVDTLSHKIPRFIEKAGRAGVKRVFIGLESINPQSLLGALKRQNRITEYRSLFQGWHSIGAHTYAGYILGFPEDTPETILRDIKIIQRELPVDLLEFFILTPLPGSQDHKILYEHGVKMESDMNKYDTVHVTTDHPRMSREEWQGIYQKAWDAYYTLEHVETVIRRAKEWSLDPRKMMFMLLSFYACVRFEKVHPLEGGIFRRKYRRDRRRGMPWENPLIFYCRYVWETLDKYTRFLWMTLRYLRVLRRVERGTSQPGFRDIAMDPVRQSELDELDLFTVTDAARAAANKKRVSVTRLHRPVEEGVRLA